MNRSCRIAALAAWAWAWAGGAAGQERPPLGEVPSITEGLIDTAIAYEIGRRCDTLDGRRLQGIAFLLSLRAEARRLGYSAEEIDAFVSEGPEKERLEGIARERLRALGAVEGEWETYCTVGRAQVAEGTRIGGLLTD
ncbi:DUF5333 domain-containing protein [Rubellimicrobium aerolatum]|uniref:DUF5333 domain-containing protein n=1 Tax=Rubellimicrobium aerolatum TaxID=490979 RepID=A0ABW0SBS4_9RHOB|nr:DUF5333 domain-containing protein [Rubellimicrobium aerolatum]MBP1805881.1 hypothetical protein [Rubellimicrobium aerolatum]